MPVYAAARGGPDAVNGTDPDTFFQDGEAAGFSGL